MLVARSPFPRPWLAVLTAPLVLLLVLSCGLTRAAWGDTIYLKNGSSIDGTVLGTNDGMVILRIGNVGRIEIPEKEIENIERNDRTGYVDPGRKGRDRDDDSDKPLIGSGGKDGEKSHGDADGEATDPKSAAASEEKPIDPELEEEIEGLTQELTRQRTRVRVRAENKLDAIGEPMVPYLRKYSRHPFVRARVAVFRLYKKHGDFAVAEVCLEGLDDDDRFVRKLAWETLQQLSGKSWSFPWDDEEATEQRRERALERWRNWVEEETARREAEAAEAAEASAGQE